MNRWLVGASGVAAFGALFLVGFAWGAATAEDSVQDSSETPLPIDRPSTPSTAAPAADDAPPDCPQRLEACREVARLQREGLTGSPRPWAPDRPEGYHPDDVHAAIDAVAEACPDAPTEGAWVDCDEYPCLVWIPAGLKASHPFVFCDAWPYRFHASHNGLVETDRGWVEATILPIRPHDVPPTEDLHKRLKYRVDFHTAIVREAWSEADTSAPGGE